MPKSSIAALHSLCGPGWFAGILASDWWRMLAENRFAVSPRYWARAAGLCVFSTMNSTVAAVEHWRFARRLSQIRVREPLFVLGHFRSGTTHLHNLLSLDQRYASPNFLHVNFPHTLLSAEWWAAPLVTALTPQRRMMDNMLLNAEVPSEDEWGLTVACQESPFVGYAFPRRMAHYERFISFDDATPAELERWKSALLRFFQKLTYLFEKPLVLKSPPHTARIRILLEMFPDARFVHIARNPYDVFRSTRLLWNSLASFIRLQDDPTLDLDAAILRQYKQLYNAYFRDRHLIPEGRLVEVTYEDLDRDPLGQMHAIYDGLELSGFDGVEPRLQEYLATLSDYQKNKHSELPRELRVRIGREWRRSFEEWNYPFETDEAALVEEEHAELVPR